MNQNDGASIKEADNQTTSEQILQDAFSMKDLPLQRPKQSIQDLDELRSYQLTKRKEYEQQLNKNRLNFGQWLRYAKWEVEHNHDFARARSIYERALEVNIQHIPFWTHYIQFELSHKNINHARNILDRGVTTLPRVDKLWFLYVQTEEALGNYQMVRNIFERWITWKPNPKVWDSYINFEKRYDEFEYTRNIYVRYVQNYGTSNIWLKWIDFELNEMPNNRVQIIRNVFELATDNLLKNITGNSSDDLLPVIISKWSQWESSVNEYDRARAIYQILLSGKIHIPENLRESIYQKYTEFEKTHGDKNSIESSITLKRQLKYENEVASNPHDYDSWWALLNLLEKSSDSDKIRSTYQNALRPPLDNYKSFVWKRYIFLWIRYGLWLEFELKDIDGAREAWRSCVKTIPHQYFSFGKVWIHFANFEIRNGNDEALSNGRKILGRAIGQTSNKPKRKIFDYYISLEKKLGEWDRCRTLYERWIEALILSNQKASDVLSQYIEFEKSLNESDRVIALYQFGISSTENLDLQLKAKNELELGLIEFYKEEFRYDEARELYKDLIEKSNESQLWISFALFESSILTTDQLEVLEQSDESNELEFVINDTHKENTRKIFQQALDHPDQLNENKISILEEWKRYEAAHGDDNSLKSVEDKMPTIVKRRTLIDGNETEYLDFIFPEVKPKTPGLSKFLENAKKWAIQNK